MVTKLYLFGSCRVAEYVMNSRHLGQNCSINQTVANSIEQSVQLQQTIEFTIM